MAGLNKVRLALLGATMLAAAPMLMPTPAAAQVGQASLRGRITSTPDNPVQAVTIVDTRSGFRTRAALAADGTYNFPSLRPSTYRLEIATRQATRNTDEITLATGQIAGLDIDLTTAPTESAPPPAGGEDVGASPTSPSLEDDDVIVVSGNRLRTLTGGQVGINISRRLIEQLPQNSRNFLAFADLAPGVRFLEEGPSGNARIQGGAQRSNSVNVFIDGVSQKDFVLKGGITGQDSTPGNPFQQLAVGEYQVISSNYKAEFDQVSSVAIVATTRSGTNRFELEGFVDYTDFNLRAPTPLELQPGRSQVETRDFQFGAAVGGPIIPDVLHFFGSYEGKRREFPVEIIPGRDVPVSALPAEFQDIFGSYLQSFNSDNFFGKLSFQPTSRDLFELSGRYRDEGGVEIGSGTNALSTATNRIVEEIRGTFRWQHTADAWVNDLRVDYQDVAWNPSPLVDDIRRSFDRTLRPTPTTFDRFRLFSVGGGSNRQDKGQVGTTVQNDFTYTGLESHTFKVGVKAAWVTLNTLEQNNLRGEYVFDADLIPGQFNTTLPYRLQFGAPSGFSNPVVESDNFQFGVYAQDDWDVTSRLTLNLGLRWDFERTPAFLNFVTPDVNLAAISPANYPNLVNADYDINDFISTGDNRKPFLGAWQPRLGFTYRFDEEGRFSTFGGYGRSYDRNQFDFLQQELTVGSFQQRVFLFQNNNVQNQCTPSLTCIPWDPIYLTQAGRDQLANATLGGGRELRFIRNDLRVPYSDQFSLGLRARFGSVELESGYTHIESKDGFVYLLGNRRPDGNFFAPGPVPGALTPQSPFPFTPPGFGSILIGDNGLETSSDSLYFKLNKPYTAASPWSLDATYTFTEATENRQFGETFSLDYASIDDYAVLRSSGVPRHRFVAAGSVDTPIGLTLSAKFSIESPLYQINFIESSVPFERNQVGAFRRPLGDLWGRRQLDFAATKIISLPFFRDTTQVRVRVDIINLMNDRNFVDFNNGPLDTTRTPTSPSIYRERSGLGVGGNPPRTIKLSAGFTF